jgi:hypothetical protein
VVIDIVRTMGTVSGRIAVGDGAATEFFGWLELIDRLHFAAGVAAQPYLEPPAHAHRGQR